MNGRTIEVVGLFEIGTSFGIDGSLLTSVDNFLRLFPTARATNPARADDPEVRRRPVLGRDRLRALLPADVLVMTKPEFAARERAYWNGATPVGYVFAFGAIMGLVVGAIIVYQILFADVSEHLHEYATLRAMGYGNGFVSGIVLQQALILGVLGFLPGTMAAWPCTGRRPRRRAAAGRDAGPRGHRIRDGDGDVRAVSFAGPAKGAPARPGRSVLMAAPTRS